MKRAIKLVFDNILFVCNNWIKIRNVDNIKTSTVGEISYRGMLTKDEDQIAEIYFRLNGGAKYSWPRRFLYRIVGSKLMLVAIQRKEQGEKVIGLNMYYLNNRDIAEDTIHEGFIGVLPEMSGIGIATNLRMLAKQHFAINGFSGISTRISLSNSRSIKSAMNVGFKAVEKYFDAAVNDERCYMICDFERNK